MLLGQDTTILGIYKSPEKNLLASIILRAWADLDSSHRLIQADAYHWINIKYSTGPFSFFFCCEFLNLDPIKTRYKMMSSPFHREVQKLQPDRYKKKSIVLFAH